MQQLGMAHAILRIYVGETLTRSVPIHQATLQIGSLPSMQLRLEDPEVSKIHALIENVHGKYTITDLGSQHGTFVNGVKISNIELSWNDEIKIGTTRLILTKPSQSTKESSPIKKTSQSSQSTSHNASNSQSSSENLPAFDPTDLQAVRVEAFFDGAIQQALLFNRPTNQGKNLTYVLLSMGGAFIFSFLLSFLLPIIGLNPWNSISNSSSSIIHFLFMLLPFVWLIFGLVFLIWGLMRLHDDSALNEFTLGSGPDALFPIESKLPFNNFPLVRSNGTSYEILVAPNFMEGEIFLDGKQWTLREYAKKIGAHSSSESSQVIVVPAKTGLKISLRIANNQFRIATIPLLSIPSRMVIFPSLNVPLFAGIGIAYMIGIIMYTMLPVSEKELSLEESFIIAKLNTEAMITADKEKELKLRGLGNDEGGGSGQRHKGDEGKMGDKESKNKKGLYELKGPMDNKNLQLAKDFARESASTAGILGVIKQNSGGGILSSLFGKESSLGKDAKDTLGGLTGTEAGEAYGVGGLGLIGAGQGGGGTGEGTIGLGTLGTIGKGGGGGGGSGYGRGKGGLGGRKAGGPEVSIGAPEVKGSLDKEIIRRVIRRHLNETKFCYDKALMKDPKLAGRLLMKFMIDTNGRVSSAAADLDTSSIKDFGIVECVSAAIRRWEFPKPQGGIVLVTYPFLFKQSGEE